MHNYRDPRIKIHSPLNETKDQDSKAVLDNISKCPPDHKTFSQARTRTSVWDFDLTVKLVQLRLGEFDSSFKACGSNVNDQTRLWEDISRSLGLSIKSSEVAKSFVTSTANTLPKRRLRTGPEQGV